VPGVECSTDSHGAVAAGRAMRRCCGSSVPRRCRPRAACRTTLTAAAATAVTAGAVTGSPAVTAACIAAGFSPVTAPTGIAASAGAIAAATATSTGAPTTVVAATTTVSTATTISTAITVSQRRPGVQRLMIKQRKWRGGQCRASKQCKDKMTEGARLHHDASSRLVQSRYW
jgi:hypothetical protein